MTMAFDPPPETTQRGQGTRWAAIWQDGMALPAVTSSGDGLLSDMTLCLEFTLPARRVRGALRIWQGACDRRAIGLYALPDGTLRLSHGDIDLSTDPDFIRRGETVSLRYRTCILGAHGGAVFCNSDRDLRHAVRTPMACAARVSEAAPANPRFLETCRIAAIAAFGLTMTDRPAIASGTLVRTRFGARQVDSVTPGTEVVTHDGAWRPLHRIEARPRLCLGRDAPIRLRAPYFGLDHDLCVTPGTLILRDGPTVEDMFGVEQVLVRAEDMVSGQIAVRDRSLAVRTFHTLILAERGFVCVDRCAVEAACPHNSVATDQTGPVPVGTTLDRASARALAAASIRGRFALGQPQS